MKMGYGEGDGDRENTGVKEKSVKIEIKYEKLYKINCAYLITTHHSSASE